MSQTADPHRNRPAEKGRNDDPQVKDDSAIQPGVGTVSDGAADNADGNITRTAADGFREDAPGDAQADRRFDEVDEA